MTAVCVFYIYVSLHLKKIDKNIQNIDLLIISYLNKEMKS